MKALMHGTIFNLFTKIKQTFIEWLLYYPGAAPHQCRGENPMITCPLVHWCLLCFMHGALDWGQYHWVLWWRLAALRVWVSASLLGTPTMALPVPLLSHSLCNQFSDGLSKKRGRKKGVWLKTPCGSPTCFPLDDQSYLVTCHLRRNHSSVADRYRLVY